jgi:hypothetical protein
MFLERPFKLTSLKKVFKLLILGVLMGVPRHFIHINKLMFFFPIEKKNI